MKQLVIHKGKAWVKEVSSPQPAPREVLVETWFSAVSPGTEKAILERSGLKVFQTLAGNRGKRQQGLAYLKKKGLSATWNRLREVSFSEASLGYSLAGVVVGVGSEVDRVRIGDRVACAGAGKACHAERAAVSERLVVSVPRDVSLEDAATVGLGAVAIQGVRRASPAIGEIVAVIGLGVIGQLTVRLLQASGCRVAGFDLHPEPVAVAREAGLEYGADLGDAEPEIVLRNLERITGGHGVDACIITAASTDSTALDFACEITRKKGRIVVVGDIPINVDRNALYRKELDLRVSCSYGPGRYDPDYEERSLDYPYSYVRWTEQRNMACYLDLLRRQRVHIRNLFRDTFDFEEAPEVYDSLLKGDLVTALFRYPASSRGGMETDLRADTDVQTDGGGQEEPGAEQRKTDGSMDKTGVLVNRETAGKAPRRTRQTGLSGPLGVALVGAGSFARTVLVPYLTVLKKLYKVAAVCDTDGLRAEKAAAVFPGAYATSDYARVLVDSGIEAVIIATRHDLHAPQTIAALEAGKAVFVEKPVALSREKLKTVLDTAVSTGLPFMAGFNRRYAPFSLRARQLLNKVSGPVMITYRVAAGRLPTDHWVKTPQGGGRIIGEACHMVDLIMYLAGSRISDVSCVGVPAADGALDDNLQVLFTMENSSTATLTYTSMGAEKTEKELIEILAGSLTITIKDFSELFVLEGRIKKARKRIRQDKGHLMELKLFRDCVTGDRESRCIPMTLPEIEHVSEITFRIADGVKKHGVS